MAKASAYFSAGEESKVKPVHLDIDFQSHEPVTEQIQNQMRLRIAVGELKPGDQLPTVRKLAADLRVNFNTVARAYRLLDGEGLISTQHGRGTFVLKMTTEQTPGELRRQALERLMYRCLAQAKKLGFTMEEIVDNFQKTSLDSRK